MRAAQLYIKSTTKYIQLGQDGDFPFTLSKSIAEIQDVSKRNKTFSKSFKIPATEDNVKALGYPHVIGTDLDAIKVYKQQCLVIVNGNVIDDGYVYILKAKRETDAIEFECQFVGGNEAWVVALQSLKMSDIQYNTSGSLVSVAYNDTTIKARYNTDPTTLADPSYIFITPYIYQFSDGKAEDGLNNISLQRTSRASNGTDFWPAFRLDYLIDAIFGTATNPLVQFTQGFDSFELDSDFLTNNATHGFWNNIYYSDRSEDEYTFTFPAAGEKWGDFLPTEVSMLDFFMNVCKTFNLVFTFDGITLKVEPRNDWKSWNGTTYTGFYSGDIDWSDKVSVSQEIQYNTSNYKRQIRLAWSTDSYPFDDTVYPFFNNKDVSQPEVRYIIDTENNNQEGITDITLPFNTSPSKFFQPKFDYIRKDGSPAPNIDTVEGTIVNNSDAINFDPEPRYSNRLFVFKVGTPPMGVRYYETQSEFEDYAFTPTWRYWTYEETSGTVVYNDTYPFIYNCMTINPYSHEQADIQEVVGSDLFDMVIAYPRDADSGVSPSADGFNWDDIENVDVSDVTVTREPLVADLKAILNIASNSIDNINLGIYKSNTVNMPDGLYERFWKTTIDQLITTRTLVTQVLMTRNEFVSLDISKYYTLMSQRFILNKVKDFDPMLDEQMVEVELLAVDAFRASQEITPPAATLLLDQYGQDNILAYSVRKLRTAYTGNCMRVRNGSSVELDIGFDSSGNLDESALLTHCGSGDGFVVKWYDQSGNGGNIENSTTAEQPKIVSSGAVLKSNGKPVIEGNNASYSIHLDLISPKSTYIPATGQYFFFSVCNTNTNSVLYAENQPNRWQLAAQDGSTSTSIRSSNYSTDTYRRNGASYSPSNRNVLHDENTTQSLITVDGNLSIGSGAADFRLGYSFGGFDMWDTQEFIVYQGDKSSIQSNIETAINGHYTTY